ASQSAQFRARPSLAPSQSNSLALEVLDRLRLQARNYRATTSTNLVCLSLPQCVEYRALIHMTGMRLMRTNIEIDDILMREAQKASGYASKTQTVEEALRLMIRLRRQHEVDAAFGRYRWRGNLARSRTGRGTR